MPGTTLRVDSLWQMGHPNQKIGLEGLNLVHGKVDLLFPCVSERHRHLQPYLPNDVCHLWNILALGRSTPVELDRRIKRLPIVVPTLEIKKSTTLTL
jgi:hypothetical protein